ncbi:MAG: aminotransferase class III-fold pyridoxal phosphate-dependent enzyme [Armatimonadota bacterium]|nr:aminotransferase class III-fold pyridoxal phosphate-dependent enzyme [bacterium]MCS7308651.1 aminotransferase class III-fold pyridoxal phosphate-dependent enzyme [Armatimonadota bacterium]MDW8289546.1 aminotransferase class III-fold pyridoxal phosphate-dependent enzyme [Armatimonadota bacterium]
MSDILEQTYEKYLQYVNPGLAQLMKFADFGVEMRAEGMYVYDHQGRAYLDFLGGYGTFALGHRHPKVVEAVKAQLDRMPLSSKVFFNALVADFCEALAQVLPGNLQFSFLCNSGTEAVEGAIKIARKYTGKHKFIATIGGYHGKSMGSLSATGREQYRQPFYPLVPGFVHVPFGDVDAAAREMDEDTAGVILEPIQGEGGIFLPSEDYLPRLRELCTERGALLIVDEVQTGLGRTGKMFAVEHYGVQPDIITLAKALGGGVVPSGAFSATPEIWEKSFGDNPLIHTSTFGGNPLACAAGIATLQVLQEEKLPERAAEQGERLLAGLRAVQQEYADVVTAVRGKGLMVGVEFANEDVAKLVIGGMTRRGVIAAYTLNNPRVIRFEPPLIVSPEQVDTAVSVFGESVEESVKGLKALGLL